MAEGRMLRKKASIDDRLAQLSVHACLLYMLSIAHLDRDGRMDGLPVAVRGTVVPYHARRRPEEWTDELVECYILEWTRTVDEDGHSRPLVCWYCVKGVWTCAFLGFAANQKIHYDRESPSRFPAPPEDLFSDISSRAVATSQDADPDAGLDAAPGPVGERLFADAYPPRAVADTDLAAARDLTPDQIRTQAEAEVEVEPPEQEEAHNPARVKENVSALVEKSLTSGFAQPRQNRDVSSLLAVLPDADSNTAKVLREIFDPLPAHFVGLARDELLAAEDVRRPSAYVVRIGQRMLDEQRGIKRPRGQAA